MAACPHLAGMEVKNQQRPAVEMQPLSIAFVAYPQAKFTACGYTNGEEETLESQQTAQQKHSAQRRQPVHRIGDT